MSTARLARFTVALIGLGVGVVHAQTSIPTRDPEALVIDYTGPVQLSNDFMVTRLHILNRTGARRSWVFEFNAPRVAYNGGGRRSRFELEVDDGGDRLFELLVPLAGAPDTSWVQMSVYGPGIVNEGETQLLSNTASSTVAIGGDAAMDDEQVRLALLGNHGTGEPLAFNVHDLTDDWRAYSGLSALWLSAKEWSEAAPGIRRALMGFVADGGRLVLVEPGDTKAPDAIKPYGMGVVVKVPTGLTGAEMGSFVAATVPTVPPVPDDESISWAASLIEPIETHKGILSLLLLGYLVLAGPVNLFVLAPRAKRMRLFWTMPTIALAASGVMAVVILLQDGVGGSGVRASFVYLAPELNRELIVQEQVSRTGALLRRSFEVAGVVQITDLPTSQESYDGKSSRASHSSSGESYYGDWFRSRSVQATRLRAVRASRARVELVDATEGELTLLSSIDEPLDELFFRDGRGQVWRGTNVIPGRPAALRLATEQDYDQFRREVSYRIAGPRISHHAARVQQLRSAFLAKAAPGHSEATIETLSSIRWSESPVLYAGRVAARVDAKRGPR